MVDDSRTDGESWFPGSRSAGLASREARLASAAIRVTNVGARPRVAFAWTFDVSSSRTVDDVSWRVKSSSVDLGSGLAKLTKPARTRTTDDDDGEDEGASASVSLSSRKRTALRT